MRCSLWHCVHILSTSLCVVAVLDDSTPIVVEATPIVVEANNSSVSVGEATETQQATCNIVTEKLAATASATVTHALKGVCSTKDLEKYFLNLKNEITTQMITIKTMLFKINQLVSDLQEDSIDYRDDGKQEESKTIEVRKPPIGPRETEVNQENYTLHFDKAGNKVFSYFWRVEAVSDIISRQNQYTALRSPSFYVNQGYRMYIKMFPHQNGGNMYIHVGLTQGEFDDTLSWPFRLKHQVMIVDQTMIDSEDIASRVWDPAVLCTALDWHKPGKYKDNDECVGFGFNQGTIFTRNYLFNDSLLIKLDVFVI